MTERVDNQPRVWGAYIHIPFCKHKCDYCAFVSTPDTTLCGAYIERLIDEIKCSEYRGELVDTVYIGGGTPSCLPRGELNRILNTLYKTFNVKSVETTVEANPESCDAEFASECKDSGVTRVSVGLQSVGDDVLRAVGRIHSVDGYCKAIDALERGGISNRSTDIILSLPKQTEKHVEQAIDMAQKTCDHVSVYALTVENGTPLYSRGFSPDDDILADMYELSCSKLYSYGFKRYEISNFARNGAESVHNKKYWECKPYLGFGVAAHGYDGQYTRYAHGDSIKGYISSPDVTVTRLSEIDRYNEYVMLRLRTESGIDLRAFEDRFGYSFYEKNRAEIERSIDDGTVIISENHIRISPERMFVMNGIIERFMLDNDKTE